MKTDIEVIRALVAEKLSDTNANIVYDLIPWRGINDQASEAHCDHLYERCIEAVEAVLAANAPALRALLARLEKLEKVAKAAEWLRKVELQRQRDEDDSCASGATYNVQVWAEAEASLDAALKEAQDA